MDDEGMNLVSNSVLEGSTFSLDSQEASPVPYHTIPACYTIEINREKPEEFHVVGVL